MSDFEARKLRESKAKVLCPTCKAAGKIKLGVQAVPEDSVNPGSPDMAKRHGSPGRLPAVGGNRRQAAVSQKCSTEGRE